MEEKKLGQFNNIHFIGIGGIGVSAIARMMIALGKNISGSDLNDSNILENLRRSGAHIVVGHDQKNITDTVDLVVYTIAVTDDNPELVEAKKRGTIILSYPEALGLLTKEKKTIAVAGTHGKTTTTAMIADILISAQKDPTVIVGSLLSQERGNYIAGDGEYMVVEACEYRDSFLNLQPFIGVITNIDADHLDYFGNLENIQKSFKKFAEKIPDNSFLICNPNDTNIKPILDGLSCNIFDYSKINDETNLSVPGKHNALNAKAALSVADVLGIKISDAQKILSGFIGAWRRQEFKGKTKKGALVYDDYAHHPTEIKATIQAFKEVFPDKKISVIFQPHLYSRTKALFDDFVSALKKADRIVVTDIYAAREPLDESISSEMLVQKINENKKEETKAIYLKTFDEIIEKVNKWASVGDVVVTVGAGDIYKAGECLLEK